jgi:hypothetical protein
VVAAVAVVAPGAASRSALPRRIQTARSFDRGAVRGPKAGMILDWAHGHLVTTRRATDPKTVDADGRATR